MDVRGKQDDQREDQAVGGPAGGHRYDEPDGASHIRNARQRNKSCRVRKLRKDYADEITARTVEVGGGGEGEHDRQADSRGRRPRVCGQPPECLDTAGQGRCHDHYKQANDGDGPVIDIALTADRGAGAHHDRA